MCIALDTWRLFSIDKASTALNVVWLRAIVEFQGRSDDCKIEGIEKRETENEEGEVGSLYQAG